MTISLDSLTSNPAGTENGLIVRNIPSGIQDVEITDGYGNELGTFTSPLITEITDGYGNILGTSANSIVVSSSSTKRTSVTFYINPGSIPYDGEAMVTLTPTSGFVAGTPGTSFGVTAGKTLRIQSIYFVFPSLQACNLRISSSGSVTTSTQEFLQLGGVTGALTWCPDGVVELSGNNQFGISASQGSSSGAMGTIYVIGYEY
jgi:hypothetical protein